MSARQALWRSLKSITMTSSGTSTLPCEGVFAIHKPTSITSTQVIRDAQFAFKNSKFFAPWIEREQERKNTEAHNQRFKRRGFKQKQLSQVKMGHGGTLDPLATGVLILGVGNGTKALPQFLECTKSYETVVLFGAATDSYDSVGKIVARKPYEHITQEAVEQALGQFRGKVMQRPPIFSALRVQGKRLYEYAREGKEVPVEIEERPVEVLELEMVEWMQGGSHEYRWPAEEAGKDEKVVAEKVLHFGSTKQTMQADGEDPSEVTAGEKRKRDDEIDAPQESSSPKRARPDSNEDSIATINQAPCPAPACRIRMTVTSGFYVRSLAHDLGSAVDSLGLMASLVRTRQGHFELGKNVLPHEDLAAGEDVWGEKVAGMLEDWQARAKDDVEGVDGGGIGGDEKKVKAGGKREAENKARRRNSSSEED